MQSSVVGHREQSSANVPFGFSQEIYYHHEDSEEPQQFSRTKHSIAIMPQSPKPNLSVRTHELVSMSRPRREDASLNSHPQGLMLGHQTLSHFEMARLEKDRRDWRELAAFLRTNDPPRSNFMSNTDDEGIVAKSKKHAASLKIFRRSAAKKTPSSCAKPLQLPDSAVAARTTKGHWHIAISIPLSAISTFADDVQQATSQHRRVGEEEERHQSPSPQPPAYRPASAQNTRSGNISPTPSQNSIHPALRKGQSMPMISNDKDRTDALSGDAANTMKNYYRHERLLNDEDAPRPGPQSLDEVLSSSRQDSQSSPTSPNTTSPLIKRGTFGPVYASPTDIERNNSQRTDPRHSGGTTNSERTLETIGHYRGKGGGSTNGQMPNSIELPPRSSSRQARNFQDDNREATSPVNISRSVQRTESAGRKREGHKPAGSGDTVSSIATVEANEGLQHQVAGVRNAPRTPAPTRALPDLPEVSDDGFSCPNHHGRSISEGGKRASPNAKRQFQDRQEKVKALRMRDIAAQKAKARRRTTHPPMSVNMVCAPGCQHAKSQEEIRPQQVRNNSNRSARHAASAPAINMKAHAANGGITLSPIRTIASTPPCGTPPCPQIYSCATPTSTSQSLPDDFLDSLLPSYDYHRLSSAAQRHSFLSNSVVNSEPMLEGRRGSARSGRSDGDITVRTLTPPRSLSLSFASSDEDGVHLSRSPHSISASQRHSKVPRTPSHTSKKRNSHTYYHRRRESKDSEKEDVKEIKERMKRLEKDNERILRTLQAMMGMQQGVKELCDLLSPATQSRQLTAGEAAARRVSRTLEHAPLSLRISSRESGSTGAVQDGDMAQRMRVLEAENGMLSHGGDSTQIFRAESRGGWEELSAVEPLMREVRMSARISHESRRVTSDEDDEEGLGYGLMDQGC